MQFFSKKIFCMIITGMMAATVQGCGAQQHKEAPPSATDQQVLPLTPNKTLEEKPLEEEREVEELEEEVVTKEIDYQTVRPYEVGQIMIVMYHGLVESNPPSPYQRTIEDFQKDLQYMYDHGYRLLSMRDLIDNNIQIEAGYTPIVLTFDDGVSTSFSLVEENGELRPTPDCAVDILNRFAEQYPDFGKAATFYINGNNDPFRGAGTFEQRVQYLIENGYDVANHTWSHANLSQLDGEQIQMQIGRLDQMLQKALPGYVVDSISYPFGIRPKEELRNLTAKGVYEGQTYTYAVGLREGQSGASAAPNHVKYDPYNLPRVRGSEGEATDLWWSFEYFEKNPQSRYISDGNPEQIAVPKKYVENVNQESLNGKELYIYEIEE